ncbi:Crp/Fnr family transcriptional regulator [Desulfopila aestuarii]|uniref:cAMP-binding domain of CRP or a regulatory subunit of cAMP-dependent protein kinases n=1 Tax=Desulfopila aestuarii DSM 18488 TaxID=1121416 RepID=A0A1M7Y3D6_9BACT|nr:Crp/Fnr family transcriptional regulator [Desulfopila aestuarii]SHO46687.1 cAMP-binding domain of CRP or a regulatory subunit of cAMP-dependent protein kinases [Desulfopila aestuarii DSM 18488]
MKFLEENLLDHLQRPEFAELHSVLINHKFSKGSYICQPGMGSNQVFIVVSGRVRVYLGCEEKEFNLGILTKGDIYSTHTGTFVQALTDAVVLMTDVKTFRQRMVGDPEVTKAMVRVLGNILKTSFTIIDGLAFKDVNSRLVALLSNEARRHGMSLEDGSVQIQIDLSVEQIARLVGSTRQTVSMLLSDLVRAGLIERPERGKFLIPNLSALESVGGVTLS